MKRPYIRLFFFMVMEFGMDFYFVGTRHGTSLQGKIKKRRRNIVSTSYLIYLLSRIYFFINLTLET